MYSLPILLTLTLLFISFQDFRYRGLSWWIFPFVTLLTILYSIRFVLFKVLLVNSLVNMVVVAFLLIMVFVYFSLKNKKLTNILNTYIGIGDVLFLLVTTTLFSPVTFLIYINAGFLLSLILFLLGKVSGIQKKTTIPLAGSLALFIAFGLLTQLILGMTTIYSIDFFENLVKVV